MNKLHELLLTFFYTGKSPKAPGTVGSLASLILWFFVAKYFYANEIPIDQQNLFWGIFLLSCFVYGAYASPLYAKKFGQIDHGSIVIDEVVGQIFALQFLYFLLPEDYFSRPDIIAIHLIFCFASFRFFDIKKPWFIGYCDQKFKTGFGVMFDDLLCGMVTALIGTFFLKLTLMIR